MPGWHNLKAVSSKSADCVECSKPSKRFKSFKCSKGSMSGNQKRSNHKPSNSKGSNRKWANKKKPSSASKASASSSWLLMRWLGLLSLTFAVAMGVVLIYLDARVTQAFEGKRWAIPAKVFARPLALFEGRPLNSKDLQQELTQLGYQAVGYPEQPGQYSVHQGQYHLYLRAFHFAQGLQNAARVSFRIRQGVVEQLSAPSLLMANSIPEVHIEPIRIGGIYPSHNEDRELVSLKEVPDLLIKGLIAVEDKAFYQHAGVSLRGIARALWVNMQAGAVVQGGSTLTQQLVKNFYLTSERTFTRKGIEALMAILLEVHYSKADIIETYLNEIYLGQMGARALHGVGLSARYYFNRAVDQLQPQEMALLVGMIKGPSYYNPHRHPKRAIKRRNQVLDIWQQQGLITATQRVRAMSKPLGVSKKVPYRHVEYPAYLDLVKRQLKQEYRESDLTSEGLRIFTSLDPIVQRKTEEQLQASMQQLESRHRLSAGTLESAVMVTDTQSADILALVGGRSPRYFGFNRVLDAKRPVGSLIKPMVFLAALSQPEDYHLGTLVSDEPFEWTNPQGVVWAPENYDKKSHGWVSLQQVLAYSYNQATVRVGMDVGVDKVRQTLADLGLVQSVKPYPSLLLGALSLTPYEVSSLYQTIANGGYLMPLRAIRAVTTAAGEPLSRYAMQLQSSIDSYAVYLVTKALKYSVEQGTGRYAKQRIPRLKLAGKTGTTNDLRDSWFAGFSGDKNTIVWIGRDDNGKTPLTGASGALKVWSAIMNEIALASVNRHPPRSIVETGYDPNSGQLFTEACKGYPTLPVHQSSLKQATSCQQTESESFWSFGHWFGRD